MFYALAPYWWAFVGRGVFAIVYIIIAIAWPGITVANLILLFGAYVFIDGLILTFKAIRNWQAKEDRWLLLLEGLLGTGIGLLTFIGARITIRILFSYIMAWSLATGILKIVEAIRLRKELADEWWMLMSGFVSMLLAFLLMFFFDVGTVGLAYMVVIYAIVYGIFMATLGFKLRKARNRNR
ncbi:MAG: DUF308 domain-containing protein [Deltaproteobacteria bacterium]|nr:DUF308 domain-containing protein [Deltaproteobacteria bacterium]